MAEDPFANQGPRSCVIVSWWLNGTRQTLLWIHKLQYLYPSRPCTSLERAGSIRLHCHVEKVDRFLESTCAGRRGDTRIRDGHHD